MQGLELAIQQEFLAILENLKTCLAREEWFKAGWECAITGLDGFATCQLYRPVWLEVGPKRPVHFESFIGQAQLEQNLLPVALHAHPTFPQHEQFARLFLERSRETVVSWPGYELATGPASFQLLSTRLPFTKERLADQLFTELGRVAVLGELIDRLIDEILLKNKGL
jgi:hypothetical protein